jgi:hypothetical protein
MTLAAVRCSSLAWVVALVVLDVACDDDRVYVGDDALYQVALTAETPPAVQGEEGGAIYIVETRAELPIREPTSQQLAGRNEGARAYDDLPFPRLPWVERGELELQIDFTLVSLDDEEREIDVIVNGANEFHEYVPTVAIIDEDPVPLHAQWEKRYTLAARERRSGTIREEELDEVAVDLATVVNGAPNSDQIVYFENKSDSDPRSIPFVPEIIPSLIAVRIGLRASEAAPILLEATVRVRDVGAKLAADDEPRMRLEPEPFEPVVPEDE